MKINFRKLRTREDWEAALTKIIDAAITAVAAKDEDAISEAIDLLNKFIDMSPPAQAWSTDLDDHAREALGELALDVVTATNEDAASRTEELRRIAKAVAATAANNEQTAADKRPAMASPPSKDVVYSVWFGTNRKPTTKGDDFTGERHEKITRGRVDVFIPEAHRFGETGTPFWKKLLRFDLRSDRLRIQRVEKQGWEVFFQEIQQSMQVVHDSGKQSHALLFLHGFNVTFEDAAIRAAQIGCDLKVPGATAFFSWPSRGNVTAYSADEASIEASEQAITDFVKDFTENCGAEKVHVIAHSMGNRGLLRTFQRIAANAEAGGKLKFGQIFLAAPDVDRDLFVNLAHLYPAHAERTTLYASDGDLAVHLSAKLHDAPRAGYFPPYTVVPNLDTVAVPDFDVDLLGHSYFAQAEALLYDIRDLMLHNEAPAQRQRIQSAVDAGKTFWRLKM